MYQEAVRVVLEMGKASTSTLQRRLRLGYGRAARILDMMHREGIIGPPDGSRPREVLKLGAAMAQMKAVQHDEVTAVLSDFRERVDLQSTVGLDSDEYIRQVLTKALGDKVKTTFVADVAEGADAERVIRDLAAQGNQIIYTPSFGYMEPTLKVAREFPNVKFESVTGYKTAPNVAASNARYYEGRYLAGVAAGRMSQTQVAGYVAGLPIPEVLQGINAFTLGMRSVNPKATVKVIWLNVWFDPPKEREAAMTLFNQGADVLAFHTGSTAVMSAAQEQIGRAHV